MEENSWYSRYHFSVTCHTSDVAVMFCLRGLSEWAEEGRFANIGRGGTDVPPGSVQHRNRI